jgi:hypothetical protein
MRARLLPGMWHADLCHTIRAAPVRLSAGARRDRPAHTIWTTDAANLVLFGAALVDGFASGGEVGPPMTVLDAQSKRPTHARRPLRLEDRWHPVCCAPR